MNILMVAAENAGLPGGKAGGLGDVIRDLPLALAALGHEVDVVCPGYQRFSRLPGAQLRGQVDARFRGMHTGAGLYLLAEPARSPVRYWVLEHPGFAPTGAGRIYCEDAAERPFATDATKFALFSVLVAQAIVDGVMGEFDVIHLHDWHAALVAVLARFDPAYGSLQRRRLVYTIHNLSLQGIRPLAGDESSLQQWFPGLACDLSAVGDPRYPDCINPMRAAINLCHRIHTVSPTYAREILRPSEPDHGFVGGEGLERDLQRAADERRLTGILNGCEYPAPVAGSIAFDQILRHAEAQLLEWPGERLRTGNPNQHALDWIRRRLATRSGRPAWLLTSVGRCTEQKLRLLRQPLADGRPALEHVLDLLGGSGVLLMIGNGEANYEQFLAAVAARRDNLLFLCGYSDSLAAEVYASGDLFLMPSSYEPCGISQMLAMRSGQPCLVHGVGGLLDTVVDNHTGFVFGGASPVQQAESLVSRLRDILHLRHEQPSRWQAIRVNAAASRFLWSEAAARVVAELYA